MPSIDAIMDLINGFHALMPSIDAIHGWHALDLSINQMICYVTFARRGHLGFAPLQLVTAWNDVKGRCNLTQFVKRLKSVVCFMEKHIFVAFTFQN